MAVLVGARSAACRDDDTMLLERIVGRDADALGELYDRYGRVVFGILHQMLPTPEAAEEVCQDAFHRFWRAAASYHAERGLVRTWLIAIARNAAIDWRRTRGRRIERESLLDADAHQVSEARSVEELVAERLHGERLRGLVAALPPQQRDCLVLAYWGGLSQTEIAQRTATPLGTVKSRVRLGMDKLRDALVLDA